MQELDVKLEKTALGPADQFKSYVFFVCLKASSKLVIRVGCKLCEIDRSTLPAKNIYNIVNI